MLHAFSLYNDVMRDFLEKTMPAQQSRRVGKGSAQKIGRAFLVYCSTGIYFEVQERRIGISWRGGILDRRGVLDLTCMAVVVREACVGFPPTR